MAAVIASGRRAGGSNVGGTGKTDTILGFWGAALSHRRAAERWQMLPDREGSIDVSIPGYGGKKKQIGIHLHRTAPSYLLR